jgi:hypothetical protein
MSPQGRLAELKVRAFADFAVLRLRARFVALISDCERIAAMPARERAPCG